ncbi:MAG: glycogen/starch/alpha-glucan phosphorylase [Clostridia bacterium]|nr:glycogen/starch/alpha-glucan phosphorylase [Clostridia bacterium]
MATKKHETSILQIINSKLEKYFNVKFEDASNNQLYNALAKISLDKFLEKRLKFNKEYNKKRGKMVYYLCMEFLVGKSLKSALFNLGILDDVAKLFKKYNKDLTTIFNIEDDAGLGNGGLGRLASCYLDSLASLKYAVTGHSIRYDFGLFKQKFVDGKQIEVADEWLKSGEVWQVPRPDRACTVRFGGSVREYMQDGHMKVEYIDATEVEAFPYDMMFGGYNSKNVATLRLWSARSFNTFDTKMFSQGEYEKALADKNEIELITKVLYPADNHIQGKSLRVKQQYFLASASMQNIVSNHVKKYKAVKSLPQYVAIHINDTHPVLCVPELMRILLDDYALSWEEAWDIVTKTVSYTNHTILKESLEVWDEGLIYRTAPRIHSIIMEIDKRFRCFAKSKGLNDYEIENLAIVCNKCIKMTNLAVISSHTVNGVSKLHSDILKDEMLRDYNKLYDNKFTNVTNGVTQRKWLGESNPRLTDLIKDLIGDKFLIKPEELLKLTKYVNNKEVIKKVKDIKQKNKKDFAEFLYKRQGVKINPNSIFDVQAKRIHEYKRQLLNVLNIVYFFEVLKANPQLDIPNQTFIFAGKAASGYHMAKQIIYLINCLAAEIEKHPQVAEKLKVVFVEDYSVSVSEVLMPATDVSEQISLAGMEASGTGNMKAVLNGALMVCTEDGANIEIVNHCGKDSAFMFGMSKEEANTTWVSGYNPKWYYDNNPKIKLVVDSLKKGFNGVSFESISSYLLWSSQNKDVYMCLADFEEYLKTREKIFALYKKPQQWHQKCLQNISKMGYFSSDRSIEEYAQNIWKLKKI